MKFSPQQDRALVAVSEWLRCKDRSRSYFYLAGYAGTGKTTLAKELVSNVGCALFAAYTGKAASVMRAAGCDGARTLHSLIYRPAEKSRRHLTELEAHLRKLRAMPNPDPHELQQTEENLALEQQNVSRPGWSLNTESDLRGADLLCVDECSMVDKQMGEDLLSFNVPILVLGDPAQLPPIFGAGFFTGGEPDILLTEVHRQALDSPVLRMATAVRRGEALPLGSYGDSAVVSSVGPEQVLEVEQVLVGRNATRHASNRRVRELRGLFQKSPFPLAGERLICLRNNHELGILNGVLFTADQDANVGDGWVNLRVRPEEGGEPILLSAHPQHFLGRGEEIDAWDRRDAEEFDYGYALTVHKSQGSQWRTGVLFDEWNRDNHREWLYTGLTRFSERVTVVRR